MKTYIICAYFKKTTEFIILSLFSSLPLQEYQKQIVISKVNEKHICNSKSMGMKASFIYFDVYEQMDG
jgi:hypothetical protein